jgi:uncharacterized protein YndB with AHSA1/START domain
VFEKSSRVIDASSREIVATRVFDAQPDRVFEAWMRPERLERWWGPEGFTTTTHAFDFRTGGTWKHTTHGPDGTDFPTSLVYGEIVRPERIVYFHHAGVDGAPARFRQTVTLVPRGDKTELTMRMVFRTPADRSAAVRKHDAIEGARQMLDRLGEHLAAPKPELRMTRILDAPRRLVYEAWSKAEHVSRWFTPAPLTTSRCEVDLRTGGVFRLTMRMPDGTEYPMDARFTEVIPNGLIAFAATIHGGVEVQTTVTFAERDGKTTLGVHQVYSHETDATRGSKAGWTQTLVQLAEHLRGLGRSS